LLPDIPVANIRRAHHLDARQHDSVINRCSLWQ
jgi:hypothetical protein